MPLLAVNDTELYYEQYGDAPQTIVLLNGISMNTAAWKGQIAAFRPWFRVLCYDLRGQLQSGKPEQPCYSMQQHADDLRALLDALSLSSVHIVGLSYGGAVAQHFALTFPERIQRLVLSSTLAWSDPVNDAIAVAWESAARHADPGLRFDIGLPLTFGARYLQCYAPQIAQLREFAAQQPWLPMSRLVNGMLAHDTRDRLSGVNAPALVLVGEDDRFTPVYHARLLAALIPAARLTVVPGVGHALPLEAPQQFNQLVLDFLSARA